ncbi:MAG: alpha-L-rhamnosidase [Kiritimatiellae bacterium]|nr:alpha-L-rhamnosidase [Kiritimatiellia bacterium]
MNRYWTAVTVFLHVLGAIVFTCAAAQEDAADPRMRTYVYPKRIVWCTPSGKHKDGWEARGYVEKPELLLERKFGQVCEGRFATQNGCRLVNRGEPPGMILDFGRELHGFIQLGMSPGGTAGARLRLRFGESVSETMSTAGDGKHATNDHAMRDLELPVPQFGSIEIGSTGFRFLRVDLVSGGETGFEFVRAVSLMRPMVRIGGFRSSDERLNLVFETAVRTVHLCCQDYIWDGIKRDRLVWMGDLHPETMAILNVFGAADIIPESLDYMAATSVPGRWMHDMPTYTLWWIRNVAEWYRYTGDDGYVRRHSAYLEKTFDHVVSGMKDGKWLAGNFLDWPTLHNSGACEAGTQGLALMTARDAIFLAGAAGLPGLAEKARTMEAELLRLRPGPNGSKCAAAMLALSGLRAPKEMFSEALGANRHKGVSTFFGYYMLEGMSAAGENQRALDTVRDYWGGMLDMGATSFWEDFDLAWTNNAYRIDEMPVAGKKDVHGDFGQFCYSGFRHSLCHGWAGGPAPWCINHVLGIRPLGIGCRTVEVKPFLGDLSWAEGAMALPDGRAIKVRVEKLPDGTLKTDVEAPDGIRIVR